MTVTVCGIDPGATGAIAFLCAASDVPGWIVSATMLPRAGDGFDLPALAKALERERPALTIIERVSAMPGQGVTGVFRFGEGYGMLQGVLAALGLPYELVTPQTWRKEVGLVLPQRTKPGADLDRKAAARAKAERTNEVKGATVQQALRRWPMTAETFKVKARWPIADALWIAECASRRALGQRLQPTSTTGATP